MLQTLLGKSIHRRKALSHDLELQGGCSLYRKDGQSSLSAPPRQSRNARVERLFQMTRVSFYTSKRFFFRLEKIRSYVSWSPCAGRFTSILTVKPTSFLRLYSSELESLVPAGEVSCAPFNVEDFFLAVFLVPDLLDVTLAAGASPWPASA